MSDVLLHGRMLADRKRCDAYARAIASTVRPGDVVVDLGTGTGIHAVLACRAGAKKVYAIEASAIIHAAREVAAANDVSDRIEFIHAVSDHVTLPERADVLVADVRGVLPYFSSTLRSLIDARERFLRPGARIIPAHDRLHAVLVESAPAMLLHREVWTRDGIDFSPLQRLAANATHKQQFRPEDRLSGKREIGTIDYGRVSSPDFAGLVELSVMRSGRADGAAIWFDSTIAEGADISNEPAESHSLYGQLFIPFQEQFHVEAGDVVTLEVTARLPESDDDYLWRWRTTRTRGGMDGLTFDQSSFFAMPTPLRREDR